MKKLLFGVITLGMLAACNTTEETANLTDSTAKTATASRKSCPSEEIRAELLKNDAKAISTLENALKLKYGEGGEVWSQTKAEIVADAIKIFRSQRISMASP